MVVFWATIRLETWILSAVLLFLRVTVEDLPSSLIRDQCILPVPGAPDDDTLRSSIGVSQAATEIEVNPPILPPARIEESHLLAPVAISLAKVHRIELQRYDV
jgi:hypothetical protein